MGCVCMCMCVGVGEREREREREWVGPLSQKKLKRKRKRRPVQGCPPVGMDKVSVNSDCMGMSAHAFTLAGASQLRSQQLCGRGDRSW